MGDLLESFYMPGNRLLEIVSGDITRENVDAIVNAANKHLKHGGGLARIIVYNGGNIIQTESDAWVKEHGPITHQEPAFTTAGRLPCKCIIHAAGPIWGEGDEAQKLYDTIQGALILADKLEISSIALPTISTGIFGYPKDKAALVIFDALFSFFKNSAETNLNLTRLTLFDQGTIDVFLDVFKNWKTRI